MLDGTESNKVLVVQVQPMYRNRAPNISKLNVEIEYKYKCEWTTIIIYSIISNHAIFSESLQSLELEIMQIVC